MNDTSDIPNPENIPEYMANLIRQYDLEIVAHPPGSALTAHMTARQLGVPLEQVAKTLLWIREHNEAKYPVLLVVGGNKRIDPSKIATDDARKVRMATVSEIAHYLDSRPGIICPFTPYDIPILIELSLAQYPFFYASVGVDTASVKISYPQLMHICRAKGASFAQS